MLKKNTRIINTVKAKIIQEVKQMTGPKQYNQMSTRNRINTDMKPFIKNDIPVDFDPDELSWVTIRLGITDWEGAEEASLTGCYVINVAPELRQVTNDFDDITIGFDALGKLEPALDRCAKHIHEKLTENPDAKIVVHCAMGMERSPLAIVWYLHRYKNMGFNDAYRKLTDARPIVLDRRGWI